MAYGTRRKRPTLAEVRGSSTMSGADVVTVAAEGCARVMAGRFYGPANGPGRSGRGAVDPGPFPRHGAGRVAGLAGRVAGPAGPLAGRPGGRGEGSASSHSWLPPPSKSGFTMNPRGA